MAHHRQSSSFSSSTTILGTMSLYACLLLAAMTTLQAHAQTPQELSDGGADDQSESSVFGPAVREALMARGALGGEDMDNLLSRYTLLAHTLGLTPSRGLKRAGWKRIPIQTRFAPFGTKLIPSRNRGDSNGPTLLRYGRSA